MFDKIQDIKNELDVFNSKDTNEIEQLRVKLLGKKGSITALFQLFREVPANDKKEFGKQLNILKNAALQKINNLKLNSSDISLKKSIDLTTPAQPINIGSRHPITIIRDHIVNIFSQIGFSVSEGPEIEDDWHNFSALNFPEEHPARDMQDTFFISEDIALRTHTS